MKKFIEDRSYNKLVSPILDNEDFNEIKYVEHHGTNKYTHSLRVSYYSYKIAKRLGLNYKEVAKAGLLHDFAISKKGRNFKEKFIDTFTHPKEAVKHSKELFELSEMEENIIEAHMFPFYTTIPKYAESWVVVVVDKTIGTCEFLQKFTHKAGYLANIYILALFNIIK